MVEALRSTLLNLLTGPSERGQTLVEYSLILAFIATMILALAMVVGGTNGLLSYIEEQIKGALG